MKKVLLIVIGALVVFYAGALAIPVDPDEQRPGTRLSGALADDAEPDWSFMSPQQKVWIQANTWYLIPHSVTTISFVVDGELYIPCGWCDTKRWPKLVADDPNVTVKIGDKLYRRTAVKITDEQYKRRVLSAPEAREIPDVELYRMDPPA